MKKQNKNDEVFVFGSNMAGSHAGGSAAEAVKSHGAIVGQAVGLQGSSYAIPTVDAEIEPLPINVIAGHVDEFKAFAAKNPKTTFVVVKIGCGIAGFTEDQMRPLFDGSPENVVLPDDWLAWKPKNPVLVIRTCDHKMQSNSHRLVNGKTVTATPFVWPTSGFVQCEDWDPRPVCGGGLHGLLWGDGNWGLLNWDVSAKWLVCQVEAEEVVSIDGGQSVKFPRCNVVFCGTMALITEVILKAPWWNEAIKLAASGYGSKLAASGYGSKLAASGDYSKLAASGDYSKLAAPTKVTTCRNGPTVSIGFFVTESDRKCLQPGLQEGWEKMENE